MMLKVHIIGGPGSGKTTLAAEIASRCAIPMHELDLLGHKNEIQHTAYIQDALTIVAQPGWVTENISLIWIDPLLAQADYIVLLKVSWLTAASRIIRRHIIKSLQGTNMYPGIRSLFLFLRNSRKYYLNQCSAETAASMSTYLEGHRIPPDPLDAEQLLLRLETYSIEIIQAPTQEFVSKYLEPYQQKVILVRGKLEREHLLTLLTQHTSIENAV